MSMKQRYKPERVNAPTLAVVRDQPAGETQAPQLVIKSLAELGPNLPVGVESNGQRVRPFRVRPFKMKQEKALARMRDEHKAQSVGTFVADTLAMMLQTVGPHNFDAMKDGERQVHISQMLMADVFYLYFYLRYSAMGPDEPVVMVVKCPACKTDYRWYGDLGSMDVRIIPDDKCALTRTYELKHPIQFRGKEVSKLTLGPIKWDVFCRPEFQDRASKQDAVIAASIVGAEGIDAIPGTFQLADGDLDDLDMFDISGLVRDIEQNTPGPQMDIEPECPNCKHQQRMMLDWSWTNFFSRSPLPSHGSP